jgi:anti-sigma factor RsiW
MPQASEWGEKGAVSLLSRKNSGRHLTDDALAEIWTAGTTSGTAVAHPHLAACAQCRARYASFTAWLDRMHDDARAEADEAFPPERLAAQQAQVLRRLETLERPARVLAFPKFARPVTSTQGNAQRWVAAAAAAGLVIGLAAGQFVDIRHTFGRPAAARNDSTTARLSPPPIASPAAAPVTSLTVSDEALFDGADQAPGFVRISSLEPIEDITPRARDLDRPR